MKLQTHKIQKQSMILKFSKEEEAMYWNRYAAEYNQNRIIPILNEALDLFCDPDEFFSIEKLEVNIGDVSYDSFFPALQQELEKQLNLIRPGFSVQIRISDKKRVTRNRQKSSQGSDEAIVTQKIDGQKKTFDPKITRSQQEKADVASVSKWTESLVYFLDHGILPWNSIVTTLSALQKGLTKHIGVESLSTLTEVKSRMLNPGIRARFYHQFTKSFTERFFTLMFPEPIELLRNSQKELIGLLNQWPVFKQVNIRKHPADIFSWIGLEGSEVVAGWPADYIAFSLKNMFQRKNQIPAVFPPEIMPALENHKDTVSTSLLNFLKDLQTELNVPAKSNTLTLKDRPENIAGRNDNSVRKPETTKDIFFKELKKKKEQAGIDESKSSPGNPNRIKSEIEEKTEPASLIQNVDNPQLENRTFPENKLKPEGQKIRQDLGAKPISAPGNPKLKRSDTAVPPAKEFPPERIVEFNHELPQHPDAYYLSHAGVILVWAYLNTLFRNLNYLEGNAFTTKEAQVRAVHLVTFLATGKERCEEPDQLIAKLLCGFPLHEQVKKNLRLNKTEKDQAAVMLQNLIDNWTIVKNTSVEGLRSSFFARDGKLLRDENQWKMIVQQKSFDMLLDHLPYPISIVKLPWMDAILRVDWM
jgi:hypothetical protein